MTDVIILAGGFGTRLAGTLPGVPKILAPICGIPFVEILLRWLQPPGRVVFALGHLAEQVQRYLGFHASHGGAASIASLKKADVRRYGSLTFDEKSGRVASTEPSGWISAGLYLLDRGLLAGEQLRSCSLETELLPRWIEKGLFAYRNPGTFIDIGTAESYRDAQRILASWI